MKRRTPYDFVAITDHAEYYGVLKGLTDPKNPLAKTPVAIQLMKARTYKMGIVVGADVHSGYQGNEEWDWHGAHGKTDDSPQKRLNPAPAAVGKANSLVSSAGTTAVWATENTRAGIFEAMKSKETYGTTGCSKTLRPFACAESSRGTRWTYCGTALVHGMTVATRNVADSAPTGVRTVNPWVACDD